MPFISVGWGLAAIGAVILLFTAPFFTIFGGIGSVLFAAYFLPNSPPSVVIGGIEVLGFLWVGFKRARKRRAAVKDTSLSLSQPPRQSGEVEKQESRTRDRFANVDSVPRHFETKNQPHFEPNKAAVKALAKDFAKAVDACGAIVVQRARTRGPEESEPSDLFITDIVSVMRSVRFATGDAKLNLLSHGSDLLRPIIEAIRQRHGGVIDSHLASLAANKIVPESLYLPFVLKELKRYDEGYGTNYASDVAKLFVRLVRIAGEGEKMLPPKKAEVLHRYIAQYIEVLRSSFVPKLPRPESQNASASGASE